jgi:transcription initiation factor TFIIIB Brf1 subunit/transcription initiation factor TFIIB
VNKIIKSSEDKLKMEEQCQTSIEQLYERPVYWNNIEDQTGDEVNELVECQHTSLNTEGYCETCGLKLQRLYANESITQIIKHSDRSITKDLETLSIPEDIKHKAVEIFLKLNAMTKRGNKRKQLIFFCIYNAYNELGYPQDPRSIAKIAGIKNNEMTKALSSFSEAQTGYRPPDMVVTAKVYLPKYCESLNLSEETQRGVMEFADTILAKDPNLQENFPQKVAAGILLYYLTIHGINVNKKDYAKIFDLSEVTVTNMYKYVAKVDNQ